MRSGPLTAVIAAIAIHVVMLGGAAAQPHTLGTMTVENYRMLQRVARNGGWTATAYKNYLVGLFEGLLNSEGSSEAGRSGKSFCLPAENLASSTASLFEWMEAELNKAVVDAPPNGHVAPLYVSHLTKTFPCGQ